MKLLLDNSISPRLALLLGAAGHDATHVRDVLTCDAPDETIFDHALSDQRIIVTADNDFSAILARVRTPLPSVILFRDLDCRSADAQFTLITANQSAIDWDLREGAIVCFNRHRIRVRRLPIID